MADSAEPSVIVGSVGIGNAGSEGALITSPVSFIIVGTSVIVIVGVRVGLVSRAWAIGGHELSHIVLALQ